MKAGIYEHEVEGVKYFYKLTKGGEGWVARLCDAAGVDGGVTLAKGKDGGRVWDNARAKVTDRHYAAARKASGVVAEKASPEVEMVLSYLAWNKKHKIS